MTKQQLGEFVKEQRLKLNLSQTAHAAMAGVQYQRILEIEKGKTNYSIDTLEAVLSAIGLDMSVETTIKRPVTKKPLYDFGNVNSDL